MAEAEKKSPNQPRISERERFRYIGFEVFPGKPKDLFKSDAEKQKYLDGLADRRGKGEVLREQCTLTEERVSGLERIVLTVASLVMLAALFLPWYSAYTEVIQKPAAPDPAANLNYTMISRDNGVMKVLTPHEDSTSLAAIAQHYLNAESADETTPVASVEFYEPPAEQTAGDEEPVENLLWATYNVNAETGVPILALADGSPWKIPDTAEAEVAAETGTPEADEAAKRDVESFQGDRVNQEIITGRQVRARAVREYSSLSGIGAFAALGSVGSYVFSSGFVLIITAVIMLIYGVLCVLLPIVNLYSVYGLKGTPDQRAVAMKKYLKLNWLPLVLFVVTIFLSFFGSSYGFNPADEFTSVGDSYGPGVLLGSLSWGVFVALAASILAAVKGIEI